MKKLSLFRSALQLLLIAAVIVSAVTQPLVLTAVLAFLAMALLAGPSAMLRGQLGAAPDTNDVATELNRNVILDAAIETFGRAMLPLTMFATSFRDVVLQGTDKVEVPFYPLQGTASKDFTTSYDLATGAGSKTDKREITINKRKYQGLALTGREIARLPYLDAVRLGRMKGEKLAYDVIQDILSVVTAANFPSVGFTGAANTADSSTLIALRLAANKNAQGPLSVANGVTTNTSTTVTSATANFGSNDIGIGITGTGIPANTTIASVTNATTAVLSAAATATAASITFTLARPLCPWPENGRGLIANPDLDAGFLGDNNFRRDLTVAGAATIGTGLLPRVAGFDYAHSAAVPDNGENLIGMIAYQSAILAAFSPIAPPPAVRAVMTAYDIKSDKNGIALEYRSWGNPGTDTENHIIECNYGYAVGEALALKRLKSA